MQTIYLTTAYLAPISYYAAMARSREVVIEQACHYTKQTYRNRCNIVGANGVQPLSIPIVKPTGGKCHTRDIEIAEHGDWQRLHWHAIRSAYGSTPFFEYYQDDLAPFYERKIKYLFDLNEELRHTLCRLLQLDANISYTDSYKEAFDSHECDLREVIHPKRPLPAEWQMLTPHPYYQVFYQKHGFVPDMSIIDLLFNLGTEAPLVLHGIEL